MIFIYFMLVIASLLFYILYEGAFSFYLFAFILLIGVVMNILLCYTRKHIKVSFAETQLYSSRGKMNPVTLRVENTSFLPVPVCLITISYTSGFETKKDFFKVNTPVFPKNVQRLTLNISSQHYGTVSLKIKDIKIIDMLRIFKRRIKPSKSPMMQSECNITVLPDYKELENPIYDYTGTGIETDNYSKNKKGDDPSEIFDIHEYSEGDKISRIHWKLTAKQGKTMVKDYSMPLTNSIIIAVNLSFDGSDEANELLNQYDTLIETTAALSMHLCDNNCQHKILWYDSNTQSLVNCTISDFDDYNYMINRLLKVPLSTDSNGFGNYNGVSEKCGHLIYCTAKYSDSLQGELSALCSAVKYTVLLIEKDHSHKSAYSYTNNETYSVVPIFPDTLDESIENIIL